MKIMSKRFAIIVAIALALSCTSVSGVFAAESANTPQFGYFFNGEPMEWFLCNEDGNIVQTSSDPSTRVSYGSAEIPNGYTLFFRNTDSNPFQLIKDSEVSFKVNWSSDAQYIMGYDVGSQGTGTVKVYTSTEANKTATKNVTIPKTAGYIFWVTNMSTETKTLKSASVTNT